MIEVEALQSFEHSGPKKRGQRFEVSESHAKGLERALLVKVLGAGSTTANPSTAAGAKSSASPVVQASPQTTASPSDNGEMPLRKRGRQRKVKVEEASS